MKKILMEDKIPPATEQEWTPEELSNLWIELGYDCKSEQPVPTKFIDAINLRVKTAITEHEQAWVKVLHNIANEYAGDMLKAKLELAAERDKVGK